MKIRIAFPGVSSPTAATRADTVAVIRARELQGSVDVKRWTFGRLVEQSGRSRAMVYEMARGGLLPGYRRKREGIPAELGESFALVLRHGACTGRLAETMRTNPYAVFAVGEALTRLASAEIANQQPEHDQDAA